MYNHQWREGEETQGNELDIPLWKTKSKQYLAELSELMVGALGDVD